MATKNITLSLPEELVRRARILAAEHDTSVSGLVGELLIQVVGDVADYETLWAEETAYMSSGPLRVGKISWRRDELHDR